MPETWLFYEFQGGGRIATRVYRPDHESLRWATDSLTSVMLESTRSDGTGTWSCEVIHR